ncbi:MAG: helix-turn-helix domain-containing protein [Candidatus Paceibacterota bacterium]
MQAGQVCVTLEQMSGQQLRELRAKYGLNQAAFAKKFGIPPETLCQWESR